MTAVRCFSKPAVRIIMTDIVNDLGRHLDSMMSNEHIEYYGIVPLSECRIIKKHLIERLDYTPTYVIMFLIPYYPGESQERIVSLYAVPRDYHIYIRELCGRLTDRLKGKFPEYGFDGYGDHSPIYEAHAATIAGLGLLGDNGMLINEKYGSFVFLCGILTDFPFGDMSYMHEVKGCEHCGACRAACPTGTLTDGGTCLSQITQTKGELTEENKALMRRYNTAWGCDICQLVCPHNADPIKSPIPYFQTDLVYSPDVGCRIDDRAYNWKGQAVIDRNIRIIKG